MDLNKLTLNSVKLQLITELIFFSLVFFNGMPEVIFLNKIFSRPSKLRFYISENIIYSVYNTNMEQNNL